MNVGLIVAMTRDRLIGRLGTLPWRFPEDLKFFKASTMGQTLVMGRRSWDSIGKPLPGRTNVVVSRTLAAGAGPDGVELDGARAFADLRAACDWVERARPDGEAFAWIIGGAQIYELALAPVESGLEAMRATGLPLPVKLVVTWVPAMPLREGDVLFPFDAAWIARHYEPVERRKGEHGKLEFVEYALRGA